MERMFEPFVTDKERGTGLGLAISRRIVEQHGGRLTAANRAGNGAMFTVELPLGGQHPDHAITSGNNEPSNNRETVHQPRSHDR
jgi:nitrogen-specific signal transduction histidine kinase